MLAISPESLTWGNVNKFPQATQGVSPDRAKRCLTKFSGSDDAVRPTVPWIMPGLSGCKKKKKEEDCIRPNCKVRRFENK